VRGAGISRLIFVHGSGATGKVWRYQTARFPEADVVNLPGHLAAREPCPSVESYACWLHRYQSEQGCESAIIAGHSLGGAIAQMHALLYPQATAGLILIGTGAKLRVVPHFIDLMRHGIEDPSEWIDQFVEPFFAHLEPALKSELVAETAHVGAAVQLNDFLCCDRFDVMNRLREIKAPTLILSGSEDKMTPPKYGAYLASQIEGAQHVVFQSGTHYFFLEQPEPVNSAIEQFLRRV